MTFLLPIKHYASEMRLPISMHLSAKLPNMPFDSPLCNAEARACLRDLSTRHDFVGNAARYRHSRHEVLCRSQTPGA